MNCLLNDISASVGFVLRTQDMIVLNPAVPLSQYNSPSNIKSGSASKNGVNASNIWGAEIIGLPLRDHIPLARTIQRTPSSLGCARTGKVILFL